MRRLLTILLLCSYTIGQSNAFRPNIVQSYVYQDPGTTLAYLDHVTSGNLLTGCAIWNDSGLTLSVADTVGTPYTTSTFTVGTSGFMEMWYGVAPSSGANTVTFTGLAGHHSNYTIQEFSNVSGTLDGRGTVSTSSAPPSLSVNLTTTVNGDLIIPCSGLADKNQFQFYSAMPVQFASGTGSGFVGPVLTSFENAGLAGSQTVTIIPNVDARGAPNWQMMALAFKPPAIAVTSSKLPHGAQTTPYKATLTAVGGAGAYTYAASGLPGWASLNTSTGVITGTPNANGCTNVGFTVTDGSITSATRTLALCAGSSFGTIANLQSNTGGVLNTATLTSVSSGNLIIVHGWGEENFGADNYIVPTAGAGDYLSDSLGTVFTRVYPITTVGGNTANGAPTAVFVGCAPASGNDTITYTSVGIMPGFGLQAEEWTNAQVVIDDGTFGALAGAASSPLNVTSASYTAQVANETLSATATAGITSPSTISLTAPLTTIFAGNPGGSSVLLASGYVNETSAGTYTASASTSTSFPTVDVISINLIGLRPEIAGLGCGGVPVAGSVIPHRVREY